MTNTATRPKGSSVKVEFSAWVMLLLALTILTLTWFTLRQEREALTREVTRRGVALTQYLATHALDPFLANDKLSLATLVADIMKNPDLVYAVLSDRDGRVVAANRSELIGQPYQRPPGDYPLDRPNARAYAWEHPVAGRVLDIGIPLILEGKTKIGEVHLGVSQSVIDKVVAGAWQQIAIVAASFLLAGTLGSILLVTLMLRPVSALTRGAEEIGRGNLEYQIPSMRRNELGRLADTFNRMTQELKVATARAIEQEKIKKELQVAHQIQQMLLPKHMPEVKGFSFAALYRAAKEVGGDYYDFLWVDKHRLAIAMADVCGKGVPAALLMSVARSMLKSIATNQASPSKVVRELNRLMHGDLRTGLFITLFYAVIDIPRRTLTYCSAGHNPGLLWRAGKRDIVSLGLTPPCLPLGVDESELFEKLAQEERITLGEKDVVLLYTDGVTEAMNAGWEEFGDARLQTSLRRCTQGHGAQEIIRGLDEDLNRFCGDIPQSDDIAVVAFKVD